MVSICDTQWKNRSLDKRPNIVMVVLDDVGFSDLGCYGSELRTDTINHIADMGIRFNNFHVTALCSPTRACLLTGANSHAVGVGTITEFGRKDHKSYQGYLRDDVVTLGDILQGHGYRTTACGKWHLSTLTDQNENGPYDQWPTQRGFEKWYGFHGCQSNQWHPEMFENTTAVYPNKDKDYHLSADLVNRSIAYITDHLSTTADHPFFHYLAFGAGHDPLHAPHKNMMAVRGNYANGWDTLREKRLAKQKKIGIVPKNTILSDRNPHVHAWNALSTDEQAVHQRLQEAYAGFLEYTDQQLGRLVQFLKHSNTFDHTIFIVVSDNGATSGGFSGALDARRMSYIGEPFESMLHHIDAIGTQASHPIYGAGWGNMSNTPLKWFKSTTYGGGTRTPFVISWKNGQIPQGEIRSQYHHAIDVVPSLLNMINATDNLPKTKNKKPVVPIEGTSFAYALDDTNAPTQKHIQYYETLGDRAIWYQGWKAVTKHTKGGKYTDDVWELYDTINDFSEINDLSDTYPKKLQHLLCLWEQEATKYHIHPMNDNPLQLYLDIAPTPSKYYKLYPEMTRIERLSAPDIYHYNTRIQIHLHMPDTGAEGVILVLGDCAAGYDIFIKDGQLHFVYIYVRETHYTFVSPEKIPAGDQTITISLTKTKNKGSLAEFSLNGQVMGQLHIENMWVLGALNSGLRCGHNPHSPVSRAYTPPFSLSPHLKSVAIEVAVPDNTHQICTDQQDNFTDNPD